MNIDTKNKDQCHLQAVTDPISERLDELADLAAVWKRHREAGRTLEHTRTAILNIAREMTVIIDALETAKCQNRS